MGVSSTALFTHPALSQSSAQAGPAQAENVLNRQQVDQLLAAPDKVTFIDLRRADEIAAIGSLPVYLNIQVSELDRFLPYIPRDRSVVTISNHAGRAKRAATYLRSQGYSVTGVVGVENYAAEGGTLYGKLFTTPAIDGVVAAGTRVEVIREGFDGTEGPVALTDGSIIFTENRADRIVRIAPDNSVSTYLEKTGGANSLAVGAKGELLAVQTTTPGVAQLQPASNVLAAAYSGKPFNRPNDLALARTGNIYFSDPGAPPAAGTPAPRVPAKTGLYWLNPRGQVRLVTDDIPRPNGVALSPDEKTLYVANTWGENLIAFSVQPDGSLAGRHDFARLAGFRNAPEGPTSGADGVAVDASGRVYVASSAGVEVFSPEGTPLGVIALPKQPQNLAFGGADRSQLYVVGRGSVYRIKTLTKGVDRPGK
ncbi:SMP-30/gluconolactonase/LRE family protein [Croceibacterium sp. LX-88]|uniref:SMP-30/gluconolactonase/LRE family protein n=1 Tax=Croceibacterium selenioxidans TaxID=2838833 RepID=A0ABS5VZQ1_9SPHN|nr:SMP-30/gluconolactonase/LRE family protein [Croceibacterium selenioxidans]MBT2132874.1 SMP-30/gluconolactonase/LRE family protein [Croceibacterium selenioxidans]